jgi:hypothetical protein
MVKTDQVLEGELDDPHKVIRQLREKEKTEILNKILKEAQSDQDVAVERPDPEALELNTSSYTIRDGNRLKFKVPSYTSEIQDGGWFPVACIKIANMLNKGLSPVIGIFGKTQTGKSNTALVLNHMISEELNLVQGEFQPVEQTVYEVLPFLVLLRNTKRRAIMFDEAGETLNKNDYNTKMNHAVAGSLRTQSKRQIPYFFVTPEAGELDPRIREEIDIEIEMQSTGSAKITLYEKERGRKGANQNERYKFASINEEWEVPKAPPAMRKEYDRVDSEFKGRYLDELLINAVNEKLEKQDQGVMEF